MIKDALFFSKILLFGEYGIIQDSMGLSIPYGAYRGELKFGDKVCSEQTESNKHLQDYLSYLKESSTTSLVHLKLNLTAFEEDIEKGMYFDSTIPQGFGVGSSGALVAAIYDRYADQKIDATDTEPTKDQLIQLKESLGVMESYFHGKSSGIDPLICYLRLPILIKSKQDIGTVGIPESGVGEGAIFLLNSGAPGETQPMVNIFMEKMKQEGFRNMVKHQFKKYNDACIKSFLKGDTQPLFQNLKELSGLILENFAPMIPNRFTKVWKEGLESNAYYLKLCGSGGGGFILGFTENLEAAKAKLQGHELEVIYRF